MKQYLLGGLLLCLVCQSHAASMVVAEITHVEVDGNDGSLGITAWPFSLDHFGYTVSINVIRTLTDPEGSPPIPDDIRFVSYHEWDQIGPVATYNTTPDPPGAVRHFDNPPTYWPRHRAGDFVLVSIDAGVTRVGAIAEAGLLLSDIPATVPDARDNPDSVEATFLYGNTYYFDYFPFAQFMRRVEPYVFKIPFRRSVEHVTLYGGADSLWMYFPPTESWYWMSAHYGDWTYDLKNEAWLYVYPCLLPGTRMWEVPPAGDYQMYWVYNASTSEWTLLGE